MTSYYPKPLAVLTDSVTTDRTMVKLFPSSFNFEEKLKLLTCVSGEPLAITCSDECLFVAEEDNLLEVFSLESLKLMGQFRTVSPVQQLVYNPKGDCLVTMEGKDSTSPSFARVYFRWRGASVDKPIRISLMSSSVYSALLPGEHLAAEIVELPVEHNRSVSCVASCKESGCIAVGMGSTIRIFTLTASAGTNEVTEASWNLGGEINYDDNGTKLGFPSGTSSDDTPTSKLHPSPDDMPSAGSLWPSGKTTPTFGCGAMSPHSINFLLDVHTSVSLSSIAIFNHYVACISRYEVLVLKVSVLADPTALSSRSPQAGALSSEEPSPNAGHAGRSHPGSTHQVCIVSCAHVFGVKWCMC